MYEMVQMLAMAFAIGLTGALAPGPTLVATVNTSLQDGWKAGPRVAAGHAFLETLIFFLILGGLADAMLAQTRIISLVGGLALIAFGALTLFGSSRASLASPGGGLAGNAYLAGLVTSAANPYFWIWWLSVGCALLLSGLQAGAFMAALFMIGHWGADFGWYTLVSLSLDRGRTVLSQSNYRRILSACGIFLMCFGLYFLSGA